MSNQKWVPTIEEGKKVSDFIALCARELPFFTSYIEKLDRLKYFAQASQLTLEQFLIYMAINSTKS